MATGANDRLGSEVVHELFGVNLQQQGRGFYVALELFAIVRGVLEEEPDALLLPSDQPATYRRSSHDFARRLATGTNIDASELVLAVQGASTVETLEALFSSLVVAIPGRRRAPRWFAAHLYPFVGELVHYDAAERRGRPAIERYVFRDGGGWAYRVLRSDPEDERRTATIEGLAELFGDSGTSLGRVASALHAHDSASPQDSFVDSSEAECITHEYSSPWPDLLREGVTNIVGRKSTARAKRVEQLMHWVPYCLARHELRLARSDLGELQDHMPVDATHQSNPLRTKSQLLLEEYRWNIARALVGRAHRRQQQAAESPDELARWARYTQPNASFTASPRAFFSETLAAVGALNATSGRRHFTFKAPMLEALVAATIPTDHELEFHHFCSELFQSVDLVIDGPSARQAGLTLDIDEGVFLANADAFKARLSAAGLLTHYSDATSLVHGEAR